MWNIVLNEIGQKNRDKYHVYVKSKKILLMNVYTKQKQIHRHRNQISNYQRAEGRGKDELAVWA